MRVCAHSNSAVARSHPVGKAWLVRQPGTEKKNQQERINSATKRHRVCFLFKCGLAWYLLDRGFVQGIAADGALMRNGYKIIVVKMEKERDDVLEMTSEARITLDRNLCRLIRPRTCIVDRRPGFLL